SFLERSSLARGFGDIVGNRQGVPGLVDDGRQRGDPVLEVAGEGDGFHRPDLLTATLTAFCTMSTTSRRLLLRAGIMYGRSAILLVPNSNGLAYGALLVTRTCNGPGCVVSMLLASVPVSPIG